VNPGPNTPAAASPAELVHGNPGTGAPTALVESYRKLADVFHEVLSEQSLDALLERIADTVGELIPHDDLAFYEADDAEAELRGVFARGEYAAEVLADEPFAFGTGITGWAVEHREPVLANRADLDPRVRFVEGTPPDPESLIAVPLIARGRVKGALNIYRVGLREFTDDEFRLAVRFGDAAALALDNAHVHASLELQANTDPLTGLWNHRAFHERLRSELLRASAEQDSVALVMLDLDDFKRVNDVYGHATGDRVLAELADQLRAVVRQGDDVCRIGGEEFAVIVRSGDLAAAQSLAERIAGGVASTEFDTAGAMSVSVGIALGPEHAANPRELVACAELAMMTAKARGKSRIVVFHEDESERPGTPAGRRDDRSIAHLKMLHGVSSKLSRINDIAEIGATIANELRQLLDYHNCRVFLREGDDLRPVAFRGELTAAPGSALEVLATRVGIGVTGHVARTGEPFLTGDAANCGIGHHIAGTTQIAESLLAVPLRYGQEVVGVIVISKLGLDQFDADDVRLLEVLAGHASVALVNAQLYEAQRREAESAKALLELSRELSSVTAPEAVLDRIAEGTARILGLAPASVWLTDPDTGELVCRSSSAVGAAAVPVPPGPRIPAQAAALLGAHPEPFVLERADYPALLGRASRDEAADAYAVAPLALDAGFAAVMVALDHPEGLDKRQLELLAGIAAQARLALANAFNFASLERTFLARIEALASALARRPA
jgi:diguanylate cyclase (GGDEF)-like protein